MIRLDKSLTAALLLSLFVHTAVLLPWPSLNRPLINKRSAVLKITYLIPEPDSRPEAAKENEPPSQLKQMREEEQPLNQMISTAKSIIREAAIEIPPELPKEKKRAYLDYYQRIREKIKTTIIDNYPRYIACGEISLYFILLPNGQLKELNVMEGNSSYNRLLKEIAQRGIREAAPFSPFPEELNQPELSFNVVVSFELQN